MTSTLAELVMVAGRPGPDRTRAAAKLMTRLEDSPELLPEILRATHGLAEPRLILGVTGSPGCGKSTLVDSLLCEVRRLHPESAIGVVAVDPSSPFSGGALLGDRVRMMRHATDPRVFVRSLASRGRLGGLSIGTRGVVRVFALLGCELVIIETVGVGQSEIEVVRVADVIAVVLAPGFGDTVQMLKSGVMECGDVYVVNKSDQSGADHLVGRLLSMLAHASGSMDGAPPTPPTLAAPPTPPKVHSTSAVTGEGVGKLLASLDQYVAENADKITERRRHRERDAVQDLLVGEIRARAANALRTNSRLATAVDDVLSGGGGRGVNDVASRVLSVLADATPPPARNTPDVGRP